MSNHPSSSYNTSMTPDEQHLADVRQATNFRSVTRNDPSVQEIMDTSVYSVIYHYEAAAGEWVKQKQEGPLFVVRRDKAPEYALYMLNRLAVKNVTLPLVPGEMKLTMVDAKMLQVARRGEIKLGVWFTEGEEVVQRIRDTIFSICGKPSKRPASTGMNGSSATMSPAVGAATPVSAGAAAPTPPPDGLSRLFAGLTTTPSIPSPSTTPQAVARSPAPSRDTYFQSPLPHYRASPSPAPVPYQSNTTSYPAGHYQPSPLPVSQPASQPTSATAPLPSAPSPIPAPIPAQPAFPPGQTVDDLLMSILGVASPPVSSNPTPAIPPLHTVPPITQQNAFHGQPQGPAPTQNQPQYSQTPVPYPQAPSTQDRVPGSNSTQTAPAPHHPAPVNRVGNASFAQAAGGTSPIPSTPFPNLLANLEAEFGASSNGPAGPQNGVNGPSPAVAGQSGINGSNQSPQVHFNAINDPRGGPPPAHSNGSHHPPGQGHPLVESLAAAAENQLRQGSMRKVGEDDVNEVGKRMFTQDILQLIHTDPRFMDDVWRRFLERTGGGR